MSPRKKLSEQQGGYSGIAVIYARYSSHNQRDVSIEQQVENCREFAERNNLLITEVYADRAITGKTDRRPNFQRMMRDAAKSKFQYVVAWKSNRMGRNMLDAMMNDARLRDMGVRCLYTEEDFDDTAAGRFALRNMMNVNQFYSENMAEDVMRGMMDNAKKCMVNGPLPYGYRRGDDGRYEIEPKEAEVVREIFERFYAGDLLVDIGNDLNGRGIKTGAGNLWNKGSFHRILVNERYIGVYEYAGYRVEDGVPAIVRKELFYAVQKKLKTKKNPQGRHRENGDYLLTGKLFCGHCGGFMVGMSGTSKTSAKHYYYDCQTKRKEKTCRKKAVRRDWIEQKIAEATKQYIMQDEVIQWLVDGYDNFLKLHRKDSMLLAAEEELDGVKKAIKNVMAAIEQGIITPTTKERLVELEDERRRLEATVAIERAALVDIPKDKIQFWLESFREGDVEDKRYQAKLIDSFVQAVYLYDHELRVAFNFTRNRDGVTIPFEEVDGLCPDGAPEGSYKLPYGSPAQKFLPPFRFRLCRKLHAGGNFCVAAGGFAALRIRHPPCGGFAFRPQTHRWFAGGGDGGCFPIQKRETGFSPVSFLQSYRFWNSSRLGFRYPRSSALPVSSRRFFTAVRLLPRDAFFSFSRPPSMASLNSSTPFSWASFSRASPFSDRTII
nr:recombinase family protein [uncultured Oscillibacter sp.]